MDPYPTETCPFELEDETGGRLIRGRVEAPAGATYSKDPLPHVLVLHGFKGFMDWGFFPELSRRLAANGIVAVSFNMSGSGVGEDLESFTEEEAFAKNTITSELEDVDTVRAFLGSGVFPWVDLERAGLFGHSRGGGVALLHAAECGDYRAVTTWAAIATVFRFDEETLAAWRERGHLLIHNARTGQDLRLDLDALEDAEENAERLDIPAACGRITAPTLLLHGTADESVPHEEAGRLEASFSPGVARLTSLSNEGHTFGARHPLTEMPPGLQRALDETVAHYRAHLLGKVGRSSAGAS